MQGIYRITHRASGRYYIGSAVDFQKRMKGHIRALNSGTHKNSKLQAAWDKYGADAFVFEMLEEVEDRAVLHQREQEYLDQLQPYYNIATDTTAPMLGRRQSETFLTMMRARRGEVRSPEVREKIAATLRGRKTGPRSPETRQKIAETLTGHAVSEETRQKIGAKTKGYRHTEEARRKIAEAARDQVRKPRGALSPETRAKISAANKGRPKPPGFGQGRVHSEGTKQKMRLARLATIQRKREEQDAGTEDAP